MSLPSQCSIGVIAGHPRLGGGGEESYGPYLSQSTLEEVAVIKGCEVGGRGIWKWSFGTNLPLVRRGWRSCIERGFEVILG
jgi:hypothetical protein